MQMAKCARCSKGGWFFKVNSYGLCADCELERSRETAAERERKAREEEHRRQEEAKPFEPPPNTNTGCQLVYRYDSVNIYVPDDGKQAAAGVKYKTLLRLEQEPLNQYDPKAVKVTLDAGGAKIGYLYKGKLQDMANDFMDRDGAVFASMNRPEAGKYTIGLYFYMDLDEFKARAKAKYTCTEFTLTANANEEMQDNINLLAVGEAVDFCYEYDKGKYLASAGYGDIGFTPASADKIDFDSVPHAFVSKLIERESGKMAVSVMVVEGFSPGRF